MAQKEGPVEEFLSTLRDVHILEGISEVGDEEIHKWHENFKRAFLHYLAEELGMLFVTMSIGKR